jgi:hypothetical protein
VVTDKIVPLSESPFCMTTWSARAGKLKAQTAKNTSRRKVFIMRTR